MEQPLERQEKRDLEYVTENGKLKVEIHQKEKTTRTNFTYQQHAYLNNSLRFADTKAGALIAANGLIAKFITDMADNSTYFVGLLLKIGLFVIVIGIFYALFVVFPRSVQSNEKGIVYWEHIKNFGEENYVNTVANGDINNLLKKSIENNFSQAIIVTNKFKKLSQAFKVSITGYTFVFIALIINLFFE